VLSVTASGPDGWRATVTGACLLCLDNRASYAPARAGEAITLLAIGALGALSVIAATRSVRRRRDERRYETTDRPRVGECPSRPPLTSTR
jgi:hypothetical protein